MVIVFLEFTPPAYSDFYMFATIYKKIRIVLMTSGFEPTDCKISVQFIPLCYTAAKNITDTIIHDVVGNSTDTITQNVNENNIDTISQNFTGNITDTIIRNVAGDNTNTIMNLVTRNNSVTVT